MVATKVPIRVRAKKATHGSVYEIPRHHIEPDPDQPRKDFDEERMQDLAGSLAENGLLQPITVMAHPTPHDAVKYIIIAGERRWRAAGIIDWETIPAIVITPDVRDAAKLQLTENIARQDLTPLEEGRAYSRMVEAGYSYVEIARIAGKRHHDVAVKVEMLGCREDVLELVGKWYIQPQVAQMMAKLSHSGQGKAVRLVADQKLTIREQAVLVDRLYAEENQSGLFDGVHIDVPVESVIKKDLERLIQHNKSIRNLSKAVQDIKPFHLRTLFQMHGSQSSQSIHGTLKDIDATALALKQMRDHLADVWSHVFYDNRSGVQGVQDVENAMDWYNREGDWAVGSKK